MLNIGVWVMVCEAGDGFLDIARHGKCYNVVIVVGVVVPFQCDVMIEVAVPVCFDVAAFL